MTGLLPRQGRIWRKNLALMLSVNPNIQVLSPYRGKDGILPEDELTHNQPYDNPLTSAKGIVRRDYNDVQRSSVVVANLYGAQQVSIGSVMELAWAYQLRIPVVAVMEDNNPHSHLMLQETFTYQFKNLEQASEAVLYLIGD